MQLQLEVELRSEEVLFVWIAFCFADRAANHSVIWTTGSEKGKPCLAASLPPLHESELSSLVLPDKAGADAALHVATYLRRRTRAAKEYAAPVFSGWKNDNTIPFLGQLAKQTPEVVEVEAAERKLQEEKNEAHQATVLKKQKECRRLRGEIEKMSDWVRQAEVRFEKNASKISRAGHDPDVRAVLNAFHLCVPLTHARLGSAVGTG